MDINKINVGLKMFLAIVLLAIFMEIAVIQVDSFWLSVLIKLPFWLIIFTFFDWKEWVKK